MYCSCLIAVDQDPENESCTCEVAPKKGKLPADVISKYCKGDHEVCQRCLYSSRLMA